MSTCTCLDTTTSDKKEDETPPKKPAVESQPTTIDTDRDAKKKEITNSETKLADILYR